MSVTNLDEKIKIVNEKIRNAKERIKELELLIRSWKQRDWKE